MRGPAARQRGDLDPDLDRAFAWETFLVRDGAVNAFALPGGFVGLHLGLIASTASADELASVLAHGPPRYLRRPEPTMFRCSRRAE